MELEPTKSWRYAAVAASLIGGFAACYSPSGPSGSMAGRWEAQEAGTIPVVTRMVLEQHGDRISGVACRVEAGRVFVNDIPVVGTFPNIRFARANDDFVAKYEVGRDQIVGNDGSRFFRQQSRGCEGPR